MTKSKNRKWLKAHSEDYFVKRAQQEGWRSRAAFKLLEIQNKYRLITPGMCVVDLGAAPGGWSQVAAQCVGNKGHVIAIDLLEMHSLEGVTFLQGDISTIETVEKALSLLGGRPVDLVISDMAPNLSGVKAVDQPRAMGLAEECLAFAQDVMQPGGNFLVKLFQGEGFTEYLQALRSSFSKVSSVKPKASQSRSREIYQLATGLKE